MKRLNKDLWGFYFYKYKWYMLCYLCLIILAVCTGKVFELIVLFSSFVLFRYVFPSTLHFDNFEKACITSSIVLLSGALIVSWHKDISIYSTVLVSFILCLSLYVIDYVASLIKPKLFKHNRDKIVEILKGDVSKEHILEHCKKIGVLEEVGETVNAFLKKTISEVCAEQYLCETAVKKRVRLFIEKSGN